MCSKGKVLLTAIIFTILSVVNLINIELYFFKTFYYVSHMFAFKKKYFLIIQNIKDINLNNIKKNNKFVIILRNQKSRDNIDSLIKFRKKCKIKGIEFFVANNSKLAVLLKSDGIYISAFYKGFEQLNLKKLNKKILGSAHNFKEINEKENKAVLT